MRQGSIQKAAGPISPATTGGAALLLFIACAFGLGGIDDRLANTAAGWRSTEPWLVETFRILTDLGSGPVTLGLAALATLWLLWSGDRQRALLLAAGVLAVRLTVEAVKAMLGRTRPAIEPQVEHLVSYSFPSGHSANSMATYVLLAGLLVTGRGRPFAFVAALTLALAVGATRVLLGVHWPSDVLGGWSLGLAGAMAAMAFDRRSIAAE